MTIKSLRIFAFHYTLTAALSLAVFSQQTEFVPKSKNDIESEKRFEQQERKKISSAGITSLNLMKFYYRFGKVEKTGVLETTTRFDSKGNKTREIYFNPTDGTVNHSISYRYDKNGNLLEEVTKKGENSLKVVHRYDSRNNKIETVHYKADGTVDRKISYIHDETGLLLETFGRLEDGRLYMRDTYLYDRQSNVVEFKNSLKKFEMVYDGRGNLLVVNKYQRYFKVQDSVQYNLHERFVFEYDRNSFLVEMRAYRSDSSMKLRTQYVRNTAGMLLEEKEFTPDGKSVYTRILKYDSNGNLAEESGSDRSLKFKNAYKYDSKGIKTEMITYDQVGEPVSVTKFVYAKSGQNSTPANQQFAATSDSLFPDDDESVNSDEFFQILGSRIIAPDGTYLGIIVADTSNPQSIINAWGQYGFSQSPTSIFNPAIPYGGDNGIFSPFNPQSPSPPSIFKDGKFHTYLTDNDSFRPRSAPRKLIEFLKKLVREN